MATVAHAPIPASPVSAPRKPAPSAQERAVWPDPGPWLFVAAPVTFTVTLAVIIYFAVSSF